MSSSAYTIEIPSDKDVLCGKGVGSINHSGNIYFHSYVHSLKHLYKQTKTHIDKRGIVKKIIEHMTISRGGHFVRYVDGLWIEQSNDKSILTVLDCIRKKIDTPNKYIRVVVPVSDALPSSAKKQSTSTLELGPSSYVSPPTMSATKKYKRAGSHDSTKSMMTLPDFSDDDSGMGNKSSHGKQRPKKKLPEKRRRKSIESDGSSRFSCDEIYSGRSNNSALKKRKEKHLGKFSSEGKSSISSVVPLKSDQSGAIPTGNKDILGVRSFNKKGIKPMLKVNDEVYAAWWPDERSRSTNSQCSWYEGRVKSVRAVDKGADYGPVYYYSIEYDDGDKEDDLKDVYVWPQADYLLNTSKKRDWIGVKCVQDEHSTDEWAKISGFYTANIDGQERAFSLLSGK